MTAIELSCRLDPTLAQPLGDVLQMIRGAGFSWCELVGDPSDAQLTSCDELPALFASAGVTPFAVDLMSWLRENEADLGGCFVMCREEAAMAARLGCRAITLTAPDRGTLALDVLADHLASLLSIAGEHDLSLIVFNRNGSVLEQLDDMHRLLLKLDHPRLRLGLDTGAFHDAAVNPRDALRAFTERCVLIRLADRRGRRPVPLGEGEVNIQAFCEDLVGRGFQGWGSVDLPHGRDASEQLAEIHARLRDLLSGR